MGTLPGSKDGPKQHDQTGQREGSRKLSGRSVIKPESRGEVLVEISYLTRELFMSLGIENQVSRLLLKVCG